MKLVHASNRDILNELRDGVGRTGAFCNVIYASVNGSSQFNAAIQIISLNCIDFRFALFDENHLLRERIVKYID